MEACGEVYGGTFVSSFSGEQYALPEALESLRTFRNRQNNGGAMTISATDPLNLIGIILPGERIPAISGKTVTIHH